MVTKDLDCGCVVAVSVTDNERRVHEACALHFEYGARMIEAALAGATATQVNQAQGRAHVAAKMSAEDENMARQLNSRIASEAEPLDLYPIELHPRTLHALVMAQLLAGVAVRSDANNREAQLRGMAEIATQLTTISREHLAGT